jgi:phosphatidylinositol-binding clathrin assembly protein
VWHILTVVGHFFEMSKPDAERAMEVYRTFTKQTDFVVQYLSIARQYEHHTRVEVPKLKHAPVNLGRQLDEYLKDSDFEIHRRQYLAELEAKKKTGFTSSTSKTTRSDEDAKPSSSKPRSTITNGLQVSKPQANKGPDPNLIDFFDSIEQNQTPLAVNQTQTGAPFISNDPFQMQTVGFPQNGYIATQQTGFATNSPFQPSTIGVFTPQDQPQQLQPNFTGAGFGGYTSQPSFQPGSLAPIPQDSVATFQNGLVTGVPGLQPAQNTNPFRQSMIMSQPTGMVGALPTGGAASAPTSPPLNRQSTNPFARASTQPTQQSFSPASNSPFQSQTASPPIAAPLVPMATGTNPFARNFSGAQAQQPQRPATSGALVPQPTGSTNPFRQGAFVNHQTGMGWQHNQQPIGGGLDQLDTVPVFPRPAQQTPWQ